MVKDAHERGFGPKELHTGLKSKLLALEEPEQAKSQGVVHQVLRKRLRTVLRARWAH